MLRREAIPAEVADILRSGMNRTSNQTDSKLFKTCNLLKNHEGEGGGG